MIRQLSIALLAIGLLGQAATANAKDYLIEVIALRHTAWGDGAPWHAGVLLPKVEDAIDLDAPLLPDGFERLGTGPALADLAVTLSDSSQHPLLSYTVWRQPGLPRDAGIAVQLNAGQVLSVSDTGETPVFAEAALGDNTASEGLRVARSTAGALLTQNVEQVGQLHGTLTVTLGRYLHLDTSLVFSEDTAERSAHFTAHRRMRSRRIHYIDNPLFGLIVHMTPIEEPETTVETNG